MKGTGRTFCAALLVIAAFCAACTGSEAAAPVEATATPVPVTTEAPTTVPTAVPETPTPTAIPEPTADDLIEAATAALDANGVGDLIAWDVLDAAVRADGLVALTLCGWTGETVFDNVYTSLWEASGEGEPVEVGTSITSGDCLNTHLVDTAFETIREFDLFRIDISADPASFATDERARRLLAEETYGVTEAGVLARIEDGVTAIPEGFDGNLPDSAVAPVLIRRVDDLAPSLELASCRNVNQASGLYRDGALVLSARDGSNDGPHAIDWYQLVRRGSEWQVRQSEGFGFGDCFVRDDWPSEISEWKTGTAWEQL